MYIGILRRLKDKVRRKRSEKWRNNFWFLLNHNAPAHRSVLVKDFLAKKENMTTLEHPPSSPDLAAAYYTCFFKWNQRWKDSTLLMLLTSLKMRRKSWKGFHRITSRNVSNTFQVAAVSVLLHKGIIWKD